MCHCARLPSDPVRYISINLAEEAGLHLLVTETAAAVRRAVDRGSRVGLIIKGCEFFARQEPQATVVAKVAGMVDVVVQDVTGVSVAALQRLRTHSLYTIGNYVAGSGHDGIFAQIELEALFNASAATNRHRSLDSTIWGACPHLGTTGHVYCTMVVAVRTVHQTMAK
jgi:hypothetical protein